MRGWLKTRFSGENVSAVREPKKSISNSADGFQPLSVGFAGFNVKPRMLCRMVKTKSWLSPARPTLPSGYVTAALPFVAAHKGTSCPIALAVEIDELNKMVP